MPVTSETRDGRSGDGLRPDPRQDGGRSALMAALALSAVSAVLLVLGSVVPVVENAERGFSGVGMTVVLAALPLVVAAVFAARGRAGVAVGVLVGVAALAPGRAVLDLQFAADPSRALRPDLYLPSDLQAHSPSTGLWLLLAGHAVAFVAGALAIRARGGSAAGDPVFAGEAGDEDGATSGVQHDRSTRRLAAVVGLAVVAAIGLLMQPFASENVYLLAQNAFEGPIVAMAGYLLIAAALPLAAAIAVSSGEGDGAGGAAGVPRGVLHGLAVAGAAVAVPAVVAGVVVDSARVDTGPFVALAGLLGLVVVGALPATTSDPSDASTSSGADKDRDGGAAVQLPGGVRLLVTTGALAVGTGALAVVGALTPQLETQAAIAPPESPARWTLLTAGLVVGAIGVAVVVDAVSTRRAAAVLRPVLSVAWVSVLVAGTAVLDTAVTATGSAGGLASAGPGVVWTWIAMLLAAVTAVCSVVAGAVERDAAEENAEENAGNAEDDARNTEDADGRAADGEATGPAPVLLGAVALAGVLAVAAFALPVLTASGYAAAGLVSRFGTPSWGLLAGVLVVLGALALVPWSRPRSAVGALVGVGVVLALHAAAFPLTRGQLDDAAAGAGFWLAFAALIAVVVSAMIAALGAPARAKDQGAARR